MDEKRKIEISYSQAREMYQSGGIMKEMALLAFTEDELAREPYPESWEEYCNTHPDMSGEECYFDINGDIRHIATPATRDKRKSCDVFPSEKAAEQHIALNKLHHLRNAYWNGWTPNYLDTNQGVFSIVNHYWCFRVDYEIQKPRFLVFPTEHMANHFLERHINLINKAGDFI